ncbi:Uncharacterized protein PM3_0434 [Pasteurella multocida]|nr:Uncharacterized protein PM3_0434 [Pasteurella multocida]
MTIPVNGCTKRASCGVPRISVNQEKSGKKNASPDKPVIKKQITSNQWLRRAGNLWRTILRSLLI